MQSPPNLKETDLIGAFLLPLFFYFFVLEYYLQHPFVIFCDHYLSYWSTIAEPQSIIGYAKEVPIQRKVETSFISSDLFSPGEIKRNSGRGITRHVWWNATKKLGKVISLRVFGKGSFGRIQGSQRLSTYFLQLRSEPSL